MIKRLLYCLCAVLFVSAAQAQDFRMGVRAGLNSSSVWNAKDATVGGILAPHAGILVNAKIDKRKTIQAELLYSGKGFTNTTTHTIADQSKKYESTIKLNYVELPVLFQYYLSNPRHQNYQQRSKQRGFYVTAGPQFSGLLGASTKTEAVKANAETGTAEVKEESVNLTSYVRNFDVSLVAGMGYRLNSSSAVSAQYAASLSNLNDVNHPAIPASAHNGVLQLSFVYFFPGTL